MIKKTLTNSFAILWVFLPLFFGYLSPVLDGISLEMCIRDRNDPLPRNGDQIARLAHAANIIFRNSCQNVPFPSRRLPFNKKNRLRREFLDPIDSARAEQPGAGPTEVLGFSNLSERETEARRKASRKRAVASRALRSDQRQAPAQQPRKQVKGNRP